MYRSVSNDGVSVCLVKAAVVRGFGDPLSIENVTLDAPKSEEVRVAIGAVAICGSDLHANSGAWGGQLPLINGHEAAGVVVELGQHVANIAVGDHVVVSLLRTCGACFFCLAGERHLCSGTFALASETRIHDAHGQPIAQGIYVGAFAEEVIVHASQCVVIPSEIPLDSASLLACGVITGFGAVVNTAKVPPGASIVVLGLGGVGMHCLQGGRAAGASTVIGVDTSTAKRALAEQMGATVTLEAGPGLHERVRDHTEGRGADYVFVAVGSPSVVESGLGLLRRGGTLVVVGLSGAGQHIRLEASEFAASGQRVIGSRMGSSILGVDVPVLVERYLAGRLKLAEMISNRYPIDEINRAIEVASMGEVLRNVVVFEEVMR